jgi:streptogramin lyase
MKKSQFIKTLEHRNAVSITDAAAPVIREAHESTRAHMRHRWLGRAAMLLFVAMLGTAYGDDGSGSGIEAQPADSAVPDVKPRKPPPPKFRLFSGGGIDNPGGLAVDGSGNVWVASHGDNSVIEIPAGATKSKSLVKITGGGLEGPAGVAVDSADNVWVTNQKGNSVTELPAGNPKSPVNFTGGGLSNPFGIAVDLNGKIWITNCGLGICQGPNAVSTVTELNSDGSAVTGSPFLGQWGAGSFIGIAVGKNNDIMIADVFDQQVFRLIGGNPAFAQFGDAGGTFNFPAGIATDSNGNAWVTNASQFGSVVTEVPSDVPLETGINFSGGGISAPSGVAVDGAGNVWVANVHSNCVTEIPAGKTTPVKFTARGMSFPTGLAIDGNGNVWVASFGHKIEAKGKAAGNVIELIGVASPVQTPVIGPPQPKL